MKIHEITIANEEIPNGGYLSIHDRGEEVERLLVIEDDDGNVVRLKNEQIGELYDRIKPILAG